MKNTLEERIAKLERDIKELEEIVPLDLKEQLKDLRERTKKDKVKFLASKE